MTRLYLVNTCIDPSFLRIDYQRFNEASAYQQHGRFMMAVKSCIPAFRGPYMALLDDETIYIPRTLVKTGDLETGGHYKFVVEGNVSVNGEGRLPLDEFVDRMITGTAGIQYSENMNTIVEFSPEELYPKEMKELKRRYDITRVWVDPLKEPK
ncbi:MAG: hypothetical protein V1729_05525 [Candidatus Woesearchaeota archaeon]